MPDPTLSFRVPPAIRDAVEAERRFTEQALGREVTRTEILQDLLCRGLGQSEPPAPEPEPFPAGPTVPVILREQHRKAVVLAVIGAVGVGYLAGTLVPARPLIALAVLLGSGSILYLLWHLIGDAPR